jgi:16S rRNA (cytosine967-C5)-methyltransferase
VIAADRSVRRLRRLVSNLRRVGAVDVLVLAADATRGRCLHSRFDRILVDAPCSGTGTLRRHPEIRWRLRVDDLDVMARLQARLLDAAAQLVAPGGEVVYSVCSVEPEEGPAVVEAFLDRHGGFRRVHGAPRLPPSAAALLDADGALRTSPARHGVDGFFATVVRAPGQRRHGDALPL